MGDFVDEDYLDDEAYYKKRKLDYPIDPEFKIRIAYGPYQRSANDKCQIDAAFLRDLLDEDPEEKQPWFLQDLLEQMEPDKDKNKVLELPAYYKEKGVSGFDFNDIYYGMLPKKYAKEAYFGSEKKEKKLLNKEEQAKKKRAKKRTDRIVALQELFADIGETLVQTCKKTGEFFEKLFCLIQKKKIINKYKFSEHNVFDSEGNKKKIDYDIFPYKKNMNDVSENVAAMRKFATIYAQRTDTHFCSASEVTASVIIGLGTHKDDWGAPLCPCRNYENKEAEVDNAYWNCPCVPMRERKECHCMLFLTAESEYTSSKRRVPRELFDIEVTLETYLWNGDDRCFLS